jgi:hypothetical protein
VIDPADKVMTLDQYLRLTGPGHFAATPEHRAIWRGVRQSRRLWDRARVGSLTQAPWDQRELWHVPAVKEK